MSKTTNELHTTKFVKDKLKDAYNLSMTPYRSAKIASATYTSPIAEFLAFFALSFVQADYQDVQYADGDTWFKGRKPQLLEMNPLANLPYFVDGDKCVCQTNAIFLYIGEKYGLGGSTPDEKLSNTQLLDEIYDVRNTMIDTVYPFKQVSGISPTQSCWSRSSMRWSKACKSCWEES